MHPECNSGLVKLEDFSHNTQKILGNSWVSEPQLDLVSNSEPSLCSAVKFRVQCTVVQRSHCASNFCFVNLRQLDNSPIEVYPQSSTFTAQNWLIIGSTLHNTSFQYTTIHFEAAHDTTN